MEYRYGSHTVYRTQYHFVFDSLHRSAVWRKKVRLIHQGGGGAERHEMCDTAERCHKFS
ncbi:hypothetical protein MNBD_GAMMA20-1484 [hydrothermal vent metagenome]|uniref:Uncharacterized protein n=1 Tax=hydrothermal vent metagenome TaxID=652676 RepID=A0A3B0ZXD0_9ZZZZ